MSDERYYTLGEFARMLGYAPSTLRDLDKKNILKPHHRGKNGYRYYAHSQYEGICERGIQGVKS